MHQVCYICAVKQRDHMKDKGSFHFYISPSLSLLRHTLQPHYSWYSCFSIFFLFCLSLTLSWSSQSPPSVHVCLLSSGIFNFVGKHQLECYWKPSNRSHMMQRRHEDNGGYQCCIEVELEGGIRCSAETVCWAVVRVKVCPSTANKKIKRKIKLNWLWLIFLN